MTAGRPSTPPRRSFPYSDLPFGGRDLFLFCLSLKVLLIAFFLISMGYSPTQPLTSHSCFPPLSHASSTGHPTSHPPTQQHPDSQYDYGK